MSSPKDIIFFIPQKKTPIREDGGCFYTNELCCRILEFVLGSDSDNPGILDSG